MALSIIPGILRMKEARLLTFYKIFKHYKDLSYIPELTRVWLGSCIDGLNKNTTRIDGSQMVFRYGFGFGNIFRMRFDWGIWIRFILFFLLGPAWGIWIRTVC